MADIYIGVAIILFAALLAAQGAYALAKRGWRWSAVALAMVCAAGLALNVAYFRQSMWPVRCLPFSNVMVLGDPNPLLAAVLLGVGARLMPGRPPRSTVILVQLGALCFWDSLCGLYCLQQPLTDSITCSALHTHV